MINARKRSPHSVAVLFLVAIAGTAWAGEWGLGLVAREPAAGIKTGFKTIIFPLLKY